MKVKENVDDIIVHTIRKANLSNDSWNKSISSHDSTMDAEYFLSGFLDPHERTWTHNTSNFFDSNIFYLSNSFSSNTVGITDFLKCFSISSKADSASNNISFFFCKRL